MQDIRYEAADSVATITLDRPDARNAYSDAMVVGLVEALDRAESDDDVRCIIVTGNGPAFHAGGDLKLMRDASGMFEGGPEQLRRRYIDGIQSVPRRFARCDKPVIAAINGAAIGAGLDLACMCDLRIASRSAQLGSTFVRVGLVPGDGGAHILARTIGFSRALELMLTARVINAEEALHLGLVHRVVDDGAALRVSRELASELAALPPQALRLTKRLAYASRDLELGQALELAATYQGITQNTADHREAVSAMLERRKPKFHGR